MTHGSRTGATKALEGLRILESGRFFAAPLAGTLPGEMGAEVIRNEEPGTAIRCTAATRRASTTVGTPEQ